MALYDLFYNAASATFIQVGTFVGVTLLLFGFLDYKTKGGIIASFKKYKHLQVVFGTILGLTPGCGGAILVMPLYLKGHVTFGTMVATLIATMGDAAFVLLIGDPLSFFWVLVISAIVGIITGYILDYLNIGNKFSPVYTQEQLQHDYWQFRPEQTEFHDKSLIVQQQIHIDEQNSTVTTKNVIPLPNISRFSYLFRHQFAFYFFWILIILAFPLGILNLIQIDIDHNLPIKNLGMIGVIGTIFSLLYTIISRKFIADDNLPEECSKLNSLKETFIHNAEGTAFVIMWVFIALFSYEVGVYLIGGEEVLTKFMSQTGYLVVLISLLVGLIPGCGPHIILATMYVNGLIPFSALIANAICNDGDALFPMLAMDKKASFWATWFGFIPAFIIGTFFYMIGL